MFASNADVIVIAIASGVASIATIVAVYTARRLAVMGRALNDVSAAEKRYRQAVDAAPSALVIIDAAGKIVLVNRELERLFGYAREELLGRDIEVLIPENRRANHVTFRSSFQQVPQERKMGQGRELFGRCKDGKEVPIDVGLTPIQTADGMHVLSAIVDLSYRKHIERTLAAQARELVRSNDELEQFAYVASHDLQEPVRILLGYTQFLGERYPDRFDDKGRKYLGYIADGAERMHQLIADLLLYSRAGRSELKYVELDANAVVDRAIAMFATTLSEQSGARITRDPLPQVHAADTLLLQLLQNLIGNALKFHGTHPPQVHIACDDDGAEWRFVVRDNGIGINPRYAERIFQLFQRLHERGVYPGTGIGLAIAKRIVERHGGRIGVDSAEGAGSSFWFTLPKHKPIVESQA